VDEDLEADTLVHTARRQVTQEREVVAPYVRALGERSREHLPVAVAPAGRSLISSGVAFRYSGISARILAAMAWPMSGYRLASASPTRRIDRL